MGAYGPGIASTTPDSVSSVTATTVVLSGNTSAAVTATQTESFSGTQGIGNAIDATPTTTVTSAANFADYGVVAGLVVYGPGIAPQTTVASVSGTTMVLSQVPTAPLSGATLFFNAPDVNNVLTQVSGGAANVNTASLAVVSQPPSADGYITTSTTSTTGIVNMYQALSPVDNTFSATLAYCAPGFTYPSAGNCTTFTEHYGLTQSQDMGEQIVEVIETENIYEGADQAHFGPTTAAQGQTVTLTEAPPGGAVPTTNSGATVNYIDGDTYIMPIPAGLTYVPGSAKLIGGDAQTSTAGATTATYCTAAGPGCTACNFASAGCPSRRPTGTPPTRPPTPTSKSNTAPRRPTRPRVARCTSCRPSGPVRGHRHAGFGARTSTTLNTWSRPTSPTFSTSTWPSTATRPPGATGASSRPSPRRSHWLPSPSPPR